jgi:hypothetical protein
MDDETMVEWLALGDRLAVAGPDKLADILERLTQVVEAQEIIAKYDHQLFLRSGRPTKRYIA